MSAQYFICPVKVFGFLMLFHNILILEIIVSLLQEISVHLRVDLI